jgi:hypothetical protein
MFSDRGYLFTLSHSLVFAAKPLFHHRAILRLTIAVNLYAAVKVHFINCSPQRVHFVGAQL